MTLVERLRRAGLAARTRAVEAVRPAVKHYTRENTLESYERVYGSQRLLDEYLGDARRAFYDEVALVAAGLVPRRVVDVGCGPGALLGALQHLVPSLEEIVGLDQSAQAIRRLAESMPSARGIVGDLFSDDVPGAPFDLVLCTEVLEHVVHPREALDRLRRLCEEGGAIVVTVPDGDLDTFEGHVSRWSEEEFGELVGAIGRADVRRLDDGVTLLALVRP